MSNGIPPPATPEAQAQPAAKGTDHHILSAADAALLRDHGAKAVTLGVCLTMNPADIIKAYGLAG